MQRSPIDAFCAHLDSAPELLETMREGAPNADTFFARVVEQSQAMGFHFSRAELNAWLQGLVLSSSSNLTDSQLDGVAGGAPIPTGFLRPTYEQSKDHTLSKATLRLMGQAVV